MRQFAASGFRIWNLGLEAKLVYTGFGLLALLALAVSLLFYEDLVGPRTAGVRGYYAGDAAAPSSESERRGVRVEVPEETSRMMVAVSYRKLLEVTHFHLFTVPVFLLIIAHLFMLTDLSRPSKLVWIAGAWGASLVHLAAPWVIRYLSTSLAFLFPASGALMGLAMTVLIVYPLVVMWTGPGKASGNTGP